MRKLFLITLLVLTSNLYGQNGWFLQNTGVTSNLRSVFFADPFNGWAVGNFGRIINTTDGGNSWQVQNSNDTIHLNGVVFANENTGWAWGNHWYYNPWNQYYSILLKTTNGGSNWNTLYREGLGPRLSCMEVFDENNIMMGHKGMDFSGFMSNGYLSKSTNGGLNWNDILDLDASGFTGISFINGNTGWVLASLTGDLGSEHKVLKTTDSGLNWSTLWEEMNQISVEYTGIKFLNEEVGYMLDNNIYKSTNGGIEWFEIPNPNGLRTMWFDNENTGWVLHGTGNNQILKTIDGGDSWFSQPHQSTNHLYQFFFINSDTGWIAGANGTILKTVTGGLTNILSISNEIPGEYKLHQNFPNPFNPTTKIRFDIPQNISDNVKLKVYDILGKEVAVLVNQNLKAGSYEYTFDAGGLTSGVYFYTLSSSTFNTTKRMLILK